MNDSARLVLVSFIAILAIFALDVVIAPYLGKTVPAEVPKYIDTLIAFVGGVLAKTGIDTARDQMSKGEKGEQQTP